MSLPRERLEAGPSSLINYTINPQQERRLTAYKRAAEDPRFARYLGIVQGLRRTALDGKTTFLTPEELMMHYGNTLANIERGYQQIAALRARRAAQESA